ncbi:MAG: hypothetical protein A3G52_01580 [Candidatus Taylorbacteria bacterium RIFCSPLOWO2_12_FULL_43_20]|uniref:Squalene cyclase C-terminal domain-containing protein n=1 Tax=Candidatus Taylorbacteria bacterium RIFCSPLOWO2_12_FULL_43_20 TaxID=1802332 RepID=A0A1G2P0S8_9BACT|nr:MAG: hypothetical protein A2825_02150 [Candidatus Taylorbacteria bacterium RIFCSPHIGHO2_01_FULL_43_120]OHA23944.1 MAG: hypothetical protein A3B98_03850 [Candidatus Taylorbacteria bacterium RIFCSPHIGHO2_02_FULL_43_55]OHA29394.1 MAG: hypothetical protein A3E92_02550 [Candidatus Taylorbacteria bacterium RIFCSPHIGHO2_12_FULL_42_34]OHA31770.1 MAG: hypothetical protein A3B09_01990 [Candidatus Taylorbacteria bacterium RIFCSPLOWO2_01_FULL_43_83]OHA37632.1 MAG: hypothetical protein A3H58_00310 [Candi
MKRDKFFLTAVAALFFCLNLPSYAGAESVSILATASPTPSSYATSSPLPEAIVTPSPEPSQSLEPSPEPTPSPSASPSPASNSSASSSGKSKSKKESERPDNTRALAGSEEEDFDTGLLSAQTDPEEAADSEPEVATTTDSVVINLNIQSATSTLYAGEMSVSPCSSGSGTLATTSAYCAIKASGVDSLWSAYGDDLFLESMGGQSNDFSANIFWSWFADLEYGSTALNKHILEEGEDLLVTLGKMPLKILLSTTTPYVSGTTTVTVLEFGFDADWNAVWLPSASSSIRVGENVSYFGNEGVFVIAATGTDPFSVYALKEGFIDSKARTIYPVINENLLRVGDDGVPSDNGGNTPGQNGLGGAGDSGTLLLNIDLALSYLAERQADDGSFSADMYTDWAALALSVKNGQPKEKIRQYLVSLNFEGRSATDYERHAMALMSLGVNPYDGTEVDYIEKIVNYFDGRQIGYDSLVNDDIFAIFPLVSAGYGSDDDIIRKTVAFIVSKQSPNGSWVNSVDMTSAAVQALSLARNEPGVSQSLSKAKSYLKSMLQDDGGFFSGFSTSWAIQAIYALGEHPRDWKKNEKTPLDYLADLQEEDGAFESEDFDDDTRIWATSYAVLAGKGLTWHDALKKFSKPGLGGNMEEDSSGELSENGEQSADTPSDQDTETEGGSGRSAKGRETQEGNEEESRPVAILPIAHQSTAEESGEDDQHAAEVELVESPFSPEPVLNASSTGESLNGRAALASAAGSGSALPFGIVMILAGIIGLFISFRLSRN